MTLQRTDDGRTGNAWAIVDDTDAGGDIVRSFWVRLPDGSSECWAAADVTEV